MAIRKIFLGMMLMSFALLAQAQIKPDAGADSALQWGKSNAKIHVEVFFDLQCPSCASFNQTLRSLEKKYPDQILITFRHFPLPIPSHDKSHLAAHFVEAAYRQEKGVEMMDMIFAEQKKWSADPTADQIFHGYARKLGLKMKQFEKDLNSVVTLTRIEQDISRAKALKLNATPSVFLNDKLLTFADALNIEELVTKDE